MVWLNIYCDSQAGSPLEFIEVYSMKERLRQESIEINDGRDTRMQTGFEKTDIAKKRYRLSQCG